METVSREHLRAFLDDALSETEAARLEQLLRGDRQLQLELRQVMQERERGDHSIGTIWRRERLTCPTREQLGSYLLQVLDPNLQKYIDFHLQTIGCSFCLANLDDMKTQQISEPQTRERRKRYYQSSANLLRRQ